MQKKKKIIVVLLMGKQNALAAVSATRSTLLLKSL